MDIFLLSLVRAGGGGDVNTAISWTLPIPYTMPYIHSKTLQFAVKIVVKTNGSNLINLSLSKHFN